MKDKTGVLKKCLHQKQLTFKECLAISPLELLLNLFV